MAFPLKSGADLYNQQLIRAAIWNYSAEIIDPKEYATGLMYFNTNPGSNLYQKLRFRTGTEWKTIAFEEDLDVANNADFQKLKDKVDLLSGDVDTDSIISNMKEVSNFLAGFAEDANLMSVLDGKLDKSGGTISGAGTIDIRRSEGPYSSIIKFSNKSSVLGYIGFNSEKSFSVWSDLDSSPYTLIHSGNIGEYNAGGLVGQYVADLNNATANKIFSSGFQAANIPSENYATGWTLYNDELKYTYQLAYNSSGKLYSRYKTSAWSDWKTIAFTDSNVASATKLQTARTIWGQSFDGTSNVDGKIYQDGRWIIGLHSDNNLYVGYDSRSIGGTLLFGRELQFYDSIGNRTMFINSSGNVTIGASDLAGTSARLWVDGTIRGGSLGTSASSWSNTNKGLCITGVGISGWMAEFGNGTNGVLLGCRGEDMNIAAIGTVGGQTLLLNPDGGNVLIGTTEDKGQKLQVYGALGLNGITGSNNGGLIDFHFNNASSYTSRIIESAQGQIAINSTIFANNNGNVGIGLTNPSAQLHVAQDIVANGTIACKGIAAEGSEVGMGTVDKKVLSIPSSTTQQTFSLTHGLNTREITVCIYEVTNTGTNMILTDVEITGDNTISVSFGNPPTENHMVVVMG